MKALVPIFSELFRRIYEQDWIEDMVLFMRFATTCNLVFRTSIYGEKSWTKVHEKTMFGFYYWKCSFHVHNAVVGCMLISWLWISARWLSRGCSTRLIFIIVKPSIMLFVDSVIVVCMKVLPHFLLLIQHILHVSLYTFLSRENIVYPICRPFCRYRKSFFKKRNDSQILYHELNVLLLP